MSATVVLLGIWIYSYSFFFVILPDELRWLYILFFPFLIGNELWQAWHEKRLRLRVSLMDWLLLAYIIYVGISLYSTDALPLPKEVYGVEFLFRIVQPILLFVYLRLKPLDKKEIRFLCYGLMALVVIESVFGVISLRVPEWLPLAYQPRPAHLYTRATGTLVSPEAYVVTSLFAMALMFYQSLQNESDRKILWLGLAVGTFGVAISGNRTSWINLVILLIFMMVIDRRLIKWILGLGFVGLLALLLIYPNFIQKSLERLQEWRQVESRITMHVAGLRMTLEKPLWGWGYATYDLYDWQYMEPVGSIKATNYELASATSHNSYLTILAETGIVGFSLYMLPTVYYFIRSIFAWRKVKDKVYLSVLWMIIFMVNLAAQTADLRFFPFVLGYWWFALALVANTFQVEQ